jgi:hypothetical protein
VWPSEDSIEFYGREGFHAPKDVLVWERE